MVLFNTFMKLWPISWHLLDLLPMHDCNRHNLCVVICWLVWISVASFTALLLLFQQPRRLPTSRPVRVCCRGYLMLPSEITIPTSGLQSVRPAWCVSYELKSLYGPSMLCLLITRKPSCHLECFKNPYRWCIRAASAWIVWACCSHELTIVISEIPKPMLNLLLILLLFIEPITLCDNQTVTVKISFL